MKTGLFSIGLDTYWPQFPGLRDRLLGYHAEIRRQLEASGAEVVDCGLVDAPEKARAAGKQLRAEGAEVVFLFISTYALSSTVLPVVQEAGIPVVVLNVQPVARLDYERFNSLGDRGRMTGVWLEHCQACSAPEIASVFNRAGIEEFFPKRRIFRAVPEKVNPTVRGTVRDLNRSPSRHGFGYPRIKLEACNRSLKDQLHDWLIFSACRNN